MATELFIPKLGQTVEQVTLIKWLLPDGVKVEYGQEVLEVETDKAVFPVEANAKGVLHLGPYKEGEIIPVLTVVAVIGKETDKFQAGIISSADGETIHAEKASTTPESSSAKAASETTTEVGKVFASPRAKKVAVEKGVDITQVTPTGGGGLRVAERDVVAYLSQVPKVTPVAQRVASEAWVDLRTIQGSGPGGRVIKEDVEKAVQQTKPAGEVKPPPVVSPVVLPEVEVSERIPLKGIRAIIADRMAASVHTTARVTLVMDVDATEFVILRKRLKEQVEEDWHFAPGYNDLLAKIVAAALRKFPYMNARLAQDAIEILSHINVALAVDTERGLMVPVIRDTDKKNLRQFGAEFRELVDRARKGRSLPDDISGGTFTITNLGMYDVDAFTPVINMPEAAILGLGRIAPKPVVKDGKVEIRQMWTLSLVFDHRLVDGAPAARFLQYIKQLIEEPYMLLTL
jgi:pyruvate dehydrogenase E2 component (dihydrolipoamide acetyltransferase)